jgi:PKD repeat protein
VTQAPPVANFTATPRSGTKPLVVQFSGLSTGSITSRLWNFGDGTTSTQKNPVHTYQNAGSYTVSLTVTGPGGSNTKTMEGYIQVAQQAPVANFIATPRSGNSPLVVQFTDTSTGNISSWLWKFGDGTTSTEPNPIHTYTSNDTGDFTVSLQVTGPEGTDTETKTNYIHVNKPSIKANIQLRQKNIYQYWCIVYATINVTQNDSTGQPVAGATVEGTWSGGHYGNVPFTGESNENGQIALNSDYVAKGSTVIFTINKVTIGGKEFTFSGVTSASISTN